jgi:hypothetical protein
LILAGALLVALLVFIPATDASDGITIETDASVILLSTGPGEGDNWIRYYENPSTPFDVEAYDEVQYIGVNRCNVTTPLDDPDHPDDTSDADHPKEASLLTIEPSPQYKSDEGLGLVSNGFGVRTKNNCATSNGQISTSQSLTFSLGSFFDSTYAIDRIEVDVEGKQNAELTYALHNGAETETRTKPIKPAPDNGADAGTADNTVVVITGNTVERFTSVTFSPTEGDNDKALVSIEGGGDGAAPIEPGGSRLYPGVAQTLFRVVPSLLCGDDRAPTSIDEGGPALDGLVTRGSDLKSTDPCVPVPYIFQIETDNVYFDYLDNGEDGAQFVVRIDWDPNDVTVDPIRPPVRQIDYTNDGIENYVDGVKCVSVADGVYLHPEDEGENTIPWCLIDHQIELTPDGWQQIQWWHGQGDPRWR